MAPRPLSRRVFVAAAGSVVAGAAGLGIDAFTWAPRRVEVTRHAVPVPALPPGLEGLTVLHLTDLHLYDGLHPAARRVMELAAELAPDLTIVTGDLVENTAQLPELVPWLAACGGRLGTIVTLGNWEHQVGVTREVMERTASAAGAAFLCNGGITVERGGGRLAIVGLDDARAGVPEPEMALRAMRPGDLQLWAFHAPGYADRLRDRPLPRPLFALAGHTHGGQIRPPLVPAITPPASGRFVAGWYRDSFAPLYVSRGIGTSGIRARFRCPPEIGVFTLQRS